jgi:hypothetical protein
LVNNRRLVAAVDEHEIHPPVLIGVVESHGIAFELANARAAYGWRLKMRPVSVFSGNESVKISAPGAFIANKVVDRPKPESRKCSAADGDARV